MSAPGPPQEEKRLVELATGFALGELDSGELQELYDRLRGAGDEATRAAKVVWETLGTSVDLRAVLGHHFQDTVQHRIADGGAGSAPDSGEAGAPSGERSRGFLSSLAARIGIARPSLDPVQRPEVRAGRAGRWPWRTVLKLLLPAAIIVLCAIVFCRRRGAVRVAAVSGVVTVEGSAVTAGMSLPRSPTIVSEGASLLLGWSGGHEALIRGPANIVPHESGLSLSSGTAWITATGPFTLGLPDGQAHCAVPADFAAQIRESRSLLGVSSGSLKTAVRFQQQPLDAGQALVLGTRPFPWRKSLPWRDSTEKAPAAAVSRRFEPDQPSPCWRIAFTATWSTLADEVVLKFPADAGKKEHRLAIRPGSIVLEAGDGPRRSWQLSGAPLLSRAVEILSPHAGKPVLRLEGLDDPIELPSPRLPRSIAFRKTTRLQDFSARSGPPPRPEGAGVLPD